MISAFKKMVVDPFPTTATTEEKQNDNNEPDAAAVVGEEEKNEPNALVAEDEKNEAAPVVDGKNVGDNDDGAPVIAKKSIIAVPEMVSPKVAEMFSAFKKMIDPCPTDEEEQIRSKEQQQASTTTTSTTTEKSEQPDTSVEDDTSVEENTISKVPDVKEMFSAFKRMIDPCPTPTEDEKPPTHDKPSTAAEKVDDNNDEATTGTADEKVVVVDDEPIAAGAVVEKVDDTVEQEKDKTPPPAGIAKNLFSSFKNMITDPFPNDGEATTTTAPTKAATSTSSTILKIIIAGAPASGKGTQCEQIVKKYGVVHLSTGDMLRAAVAAETEVGKKAKEFMDNGKLVPDDVIIGIVKDRLKQEDCVTNGWLLDGFPRTKAQADALSNAGILADCFIFLNVPDEILVERVVGRRTDPQTGKIYHMTFSPPADKEIRARLEQRSDDTEEKVKVRLQQFHSNIDAVKDSYTNISILIDGNQSPNKVTESVNEALASL